MAIIQISKIQHRSGNLVDLPQLDEAEFGWASDQKRLFIGKDLPNENIEVLTSYSNISFSQLNGAVGNLDMSLPAGNTEALAAANGEVLVFDGVNWTNRGGNTGGVVNLGHVSNIKISGGAIGYVLETDGTGNLSWTPKGTLSARVQNITNSSPAVVTTAEDNIFTNGVNVTFTEIPGMTELNGQDYYVKTLTANTFELYTDVSLITPLDTTLYNAFAYTSVTATASGTNIITVGDATLFNDNDPVKFVGTTFGGIIEGTQYYVANVVSGTELTISSTLGGPEKLLTTGTGTCNMYVTGGRVLSTLGGSSVANAGGANTSIQYNDSGLLSGSSDFSFNFAAPVKTLTLNGNANVGNLNATGAVTATTYFSNVATGTAPITVASTTRVANLNVSYSNVSDFEVVTTRTSGTYYPVFVNGSSNGNYSLSSNAAFSFNAATGNLAATLLTGTLTTAAQPNVTSIGTLTSLAVTGNITAGNVSGGNLVSANFLAGTLTTAAQPNITSVGTLSSLSVTGNIGAANFNGNVVGNVSGNIAAAGSNTGVMFNDTGLINSSTAFTFNKSTNVVNVNGNVSANFFIGAGNNLSNIQGANVSGTVANATYAVSAGSATIAGTVTNNAQPNINSVGTLSSLTVSGNTATGGIKTDNYYYANGAAISFAGTYGNSNVAGYLPVYNGQILATTVTLSTLTTGSNTTAGSITGNWTLTAGSRMQATYADLAEYYQADMIYEPGTVLEFGGEFDVTLAEDGSARVAGVVTTDPAYVMNTGCPGNAVAIALQGRVPVKVRGHIRKGDMMISAGGGYARPSASPQMGTVIGKALQEYNGDDGIIEVAVGRL